VWGLRGRFLQAFWNSGDLLFQHPVDGHSANQIALRQLAQAVLSLTVAQDGGAIENQGFPSDMPAFELGRRMPARTRSTIRLRSSSATAPMTTTTARPSGSPVSICSLKLMYSMLIQR